MLTSLVRRVNVILLYEINKHTKRVCKECFPTDCMDNARRLSLEQMDLDLDSSSVT